MKLVLVRHGESEWNKLNLFTGWTDVDLSEKGHEEAKNAGRILKAEGYDFDGLCNDRSGGYGVGCFSADACREIPSQLCFDNSKCGASGTCGSFDIDNSKPYVDQYRENCEVSFPFSDNIKINSKNESVIKKL